MSAGDAGARQQREREHHRQIARHAEVVWQWDSPTGSRRARRRADLLVEKGGLTRGVRALEIGCGTGVFLEMAAASGASIDALDLSIELLGKAKTRVASHAGVRLTCGDVQRLPFPEKSFDVVYGSSVLHHLELGKSLQEVHRVLKPGGRIAFAEPNLLNPHIAFTFLVGPRRLLGLSPDEMAFTRFKAQRALQQLGFEEIVVTPHDFLYPLIPRALIGAVLGLGRILEGTPLVREIAGSLLIHARRR